MDSLQSQPKSPPIPTYLKSNGKFVQLRFLHKVSAMVVDKFILQKAAVNGLVDSIITKQEQQDLNDAQSVIESGRYPCRFKGCNKSYKHDGKKRRNHEMIHDPPPPVPVVKLELKEQPDKVISKSKKDDMYN